MASMRAEIVICGAGIAGIAAAHSLSKNGHKDILLLDAGSPLALTSDKSTEAYRNWWRDDAMIALMNRSIDLMEELAKKHNNVFRLNRRGYLYATADAAKIPEFQSTAQRAYKFGAGPIRLYGKKSRIHVARACCGVLHDGQAESPQYQAAAQEDFEDQPTGCDLILDPQMIKFQFPYLSSATVAALHARRCGWFSGQQLGILLYELALKHGVRFMNAEVVEVTTQGNRVREVVVRQDNTLSNIRTSVFVNAAGPRLQEVSELLGHSLPIFFERHLKLSFRDTLGIIPRDAPLLIWDDAQYLNWTEEERNLLAGEEDLRVLLDLLAPGAHLRPEGGSESENILLLWPYDTDPVAPQYPMPISEVFPEVTLRGLVTLVPGLEAYVNNMPKPFVDGGYYVKTPGNRMLCGPLPVDGAFVLGALSGYGLMAACAAGELLEAHIAGTALPSYASAFVPARFDDPAYLDKVNSWGPSSQL